MNNSSEGKKETDSEARERLSKLFSKNTLELCSQKQEIDLLKSVIRTLVQLNDERLVNE